MASPSRADVHVPNGAGGLASQAAYLTSLQVINVPGPSPGGSYPSASVGPRGYIGDTGPGVYSGPSLPPPSFGSLRDFWIDTRPDQNKLYGPKVSNLAWPATGIQLRGNTISQGIGPPSDAWAPYPGDAYLDLSQLILYIAA